MFRLEVAWRGWKLQAAEKQVELYFYGQVHSRGPSSSKCESFLLLSGVFGKLFISENQNNHEVFS